MAVNDIKIGSASVDIIVTSDKLDADFKRAKDKSKKAANELQNNLNKIKLKMDDRLAKISLANVRKLHKKLKQRLEEKIHLRFDQASINRTKAQLRSVEAALEKVRLKSQGVKSGRAGFGSLLGGAGGLAKAGVITYVLSQVVRLGKQGAVAQGKIEGVEEAFNRLNQPNLLSELRKATRNTVSDFELMKITMRASNFRIPLGQLATFLAFAQKRAVQTGESVDYLVNSIVDGIGRKSTLVLDNLGISATELQAEVKKVGDFGKATGNIVSRELEKMGSVANNASQKVAKIGAKLENIGSRLGKTLKPVFSQTLDMLDDLIDGIDTLILKAQGYGDAAPIPQLDFEAGKFSEEELNRLKTGVSFIPGEGFKKLTKDNKEFIKTVSILKDELEDLQKELETTVGIEDIKTRDLLLKQIKAKQKVIDSFLKPSKFDQKEIKIDKINFELELGNLDAELADLGVRDRIKDFIGNSANASKNDINVASGALFDLILGNISSGDAETILENIINKTNEYEVARTNLSDKEKKDLFERLSQEEEIHNLRMNSISEFGNALEGLGSHGETMVSYFNAALQTALRISDAIDTMKTDQLSGILGIASGGFGFISKLFGLKGGGSVTNSGGGNVSFQPYKKFASGVNDFIVPPGYNRDNYIVGVQSGEKLNVTPANQVGNGTVTMEKILRDVYNRIGALTEVVRDQKTSVTVVNTETNVESTVLETKSAENRMTRSGYKLKDV